jgi:hypothetical protein
MADHRRLPERVDRELDLVAETAGADLDAAGHAIEGEWHRQDGFERIALGAAVRRHVRLAAGDAAGEVEDVRDRRRWHAGAVVNYRDCARLDPHHDLRGDARLFTAVERVIEQLLEHDQRPSFRLMPGLCHQLLAAAELDQAARAERRALQGRHGRRHESSHTRHRSARWSGSNGLRW